MANEEKDSNIIISGCKAGNRKAQEQLYRSYYRVMMNLCLRYTRNEADALEVLNSGFYRVFKHIHTYDSGKATLYTWIRTIIINTCLDFLRSNKGQTVREDLTQAASVDLPPEVFIKMSADEILVLVRRLPPATRAVFNLFVMEGYSHREIAVMMGISEGTSKWHLSEARKQLKEQIKNKESGS